MAVQHRHAWDILRTQGNQKQWNAQTQYGLPMKLRPYPFQAWPLPMQAFNMQIASEVSASRANHQHQQQTVFGPDLLAEQIHSQHHQHHQGIGLHRSKDTDAKIDQNTRQHRGGNIGRDVFHHPCKQTTDAQYKSQESSEHRSGQGFIQGNACGQGNQCCTRSRPSNVNRHAVTPRQGHAGKTTEQSQNREP